MQHQNTIQRAKDRLEYLKSISSEKGNIVKAVKVDKNDALVKRFISRLERS